MSVRTNYKDHAGSIYWVGTYTMKTGTTGYTCWYKAKGMIKPRSIGVMPLVYDKAIAEQRLMEYAEKRGWTTMEVQDELFDETDSVLEL